MWGEIMRSGPMRGIAGPLAGALFVLSLGALLGGIALAAQGVYYEPTIRDMVRKYCARCHSGNLRNLTSWDSVRAYVDNGMLAAMLQGPMRQFGGPDADVMLAWIEAGAPENPPRAAKDPRPAALLVEQGPTQTPPLTYTGAVKDVLAKDCLRCHMGPFRKLTTYAEVKAYVDNGQLARMTQPGGPMRPFAGSDVQTLQAWIEAGAPQ